MIQDENGAVGINFREGLIAKCRVINYLWWWIVHEMAWHILFFITAVFSIITNCMPVLPYKVSTTSYEAFISDIIIIFYKKVGILYLMYGHNCIICFTICFPSTICLIIKSPKSCCIREVTLVACGTSEYYMEISIPGKQLYEDYYGTACLWDT